ncbi:hypothetical protein LNKW23_05590 [Paralimibaculum aggregatum]|uniref:Cell division protein ZapA n=1 Tax=Paralimibaculum aggregatum TaxID=3036245 RepID=A0ABQ6LDB0_9RHOB|nr:cell division protein ZapA [Limibaculum sp. NKW23]GMG81346.1 hypothetical protein LNKW23_05590 [Limibaculum sp. NKW23]
MSDVTVEVAGRAYRLGCADGEEGHLRGLAQAVDGEARRLLRQLQTQPDEGRLLLMVALTLADRMVELDAGSEAETARIAEAEAAAAAHAEAMAAAEARIAELEAALAEGGERHAEAAEAEIEAAEAAAEAARAAAAEAGRRAEAEAAARKEAEGRVSALEGAVAAALTETAELRRALEEARSGALGDGEAAPDLFAGDAAQGDERAERIEQLANRIEHLTEQISLHLGDR